jgi:hypothetical protein
MEKEVRIYVVEAYEHSFVHPDNECADAGTFLTVDAPSEDAVPSAPTCGACDTPYTYSAFTGRRGHFESV